LGAADLALRQ
jgi:hypothetical protein